MTDRHTIHVMISGRVQHVWYRGWMVQQANTIGLDGWVRNRLGGKVEAIFYGPKDKVSELMTSCRKGPPAAAVDDISIVSAKTGDPYKLTGQGFEQRSTV